jgi:hypothetical protein
MTYKDFKDLHLFVNSHTGNPSLKNLVIKNVKVGKEAINIARLFDLNISSLMLPSGTGLSGFSHDEEFVTFVNQGNGSYTLSTGGVFSVPEYYYDETIRNYVNQIFIDCPMYDTTDTSDIKAMYELFGMEANND